MASCSAPSGGTGSCSQEWPSKEFRILVEDLVDRITEAHRHEVGALHLQLEALRAQLAAGCGAPGKEAGDDGAKACGLKFGHHLLPEAAAVRKIPPPTEAPSELKMDAAAQQSRIDFEIQSAVSEHALDPPNVVPAKVDATCAPLTDSEDSRVQAWNGGDNEQNEQSASPVFAAAKGSQDWLRVCPAFRVAKEGERRRRDGAAAEAEEPRACHEKSASSTASTHVRYVSEQESERPQWQWMHRTGWRPYAEEASMKIESAYQGGDSKARLKSGKQGSNPMEIFFADMLQYDASSGNQREVRRVGPDPWWQRLKREARTYYRAWETGRPRKETFEDYQGRSEDPTLTVFTSPLEDIDVSDDEFTTSCLGKVARSSVFKTLAILLVLLNAVWIAVELDHNDEIVLSDADMGFQIMENAFCALFTAEIMVRFLAFKRKCAAFHDSWFRFDCVLVFMMIFETWLVPLYFFMATGGSGDSVAGNFQVLRIARLLRLTRMTRLFKAVPEFITLLKGIVTSVRPVAVTLILLLILIYVFGIVFRSQVDAGSHLEEKYFSSVPHAMTTLLLHGTFLDSVALVTKEISTEPGFSMFSGIGMACVFMISIFCTCFTVMNMLIGIVCEMVSVVKQVEEERMAKNMLTSQLMDILVVYDGDNCMALNRSEFELFMKNAEVRQVLAEYEVDVKGVQTLTEVLFLSDEMSDMRNGEIKLNFNEILELVVRMKGDNTPTVEDIVQLRQYTKHRLDCLEKRLIQSQALMQEHLISAQEASLSDVQEALRASRRAST